MKNVLLIFGGMSYEHDISVVTASQIFNNTKLENVRLVPVYISRENRFFLYENKKFEIKDFSMNSFSQQSKKFKELLFVSGETNKIFQRTLFGLKEFMTVQNAIIACHGGFGENGKLVSILEHFGIKCSSGNFEALAVCMNKFLFKQVMKGIKVQVVPGFKINKIDFENIDFKRKLELRMRLFKFPVVVKPSSGGSSIGIFVAKNEKEFKSCLKDCFEFDEEVIVEKLISNAREFNVAIVGTSENFEVSDVDEPLKVEEILSFEDKYLTGEKSSKKMIDSVGSMAEQKRRFPADVSIELKENLRKTAAKIFKELNLSGIVRIDFLFDEKNEKLYVGEVNAVPGSLAYYFFSENKISTNKLVLKLIDISNKKDDEKALFKKDFVTNILDTDWFVIYFITNFFYYFGILPYFVL